MSKLKKQDKAKHKKAPKDAAEHVPPSSTDQRFDTFKCYRLDGVPEEALPFANQEYKGKHSYTALVQGAVPRF